MGVVVVTGGALTTIQDGGRRGLAHLGVPPSGAADQPSFRLANRLVGNSEDAPALETTLIGPELLFERGAVVALTGAVSEASIEGRPIALNRPVHVPGGATLKVGRARSGLRTYIAIRGGVDAELILGSASTDLLSGLGPPPLSSGQRLAIGEPKGALPGVDVAPVSPRVAPAVVRLILGPRHDWFTTGARERLLTSPFAVTQDSNRIGVRLSGPRLERTRQGELLSEGVVGGALQVPESGQPIILLADHPTTGGYPVIGVIHSADLPALAQLVPGDEVRFKAVSTH